MSSVELDLADEEVEHVAGLVIPAIVPPPLHLHAVLLALTVVGLPRPPRGEDHGLVARLPVPLALIGKVIPSDPETEGKTR